MRGRGNGEGNSSIDSECGLTSGPTVTGPGAVPLGVAVRGECGGDPPSWFRSFRVICGLDCESRLTSGKGRPVRKTFWHKATNIRTSDVSLSIFLFSCPPPSFFDPLQESFSNHVSSAFPLLLTSTQLPYGSSGATTSGNGRRRNKGGGFQAQIAGGLGKSGNGLSSAKDFEVEADLGEIRRGNKRRRAAAAAVKV